MFIAMSDELISISSFFTESTLTMLQERVGRREKSDSSTGRNPFENRWIESGHCAKWTTRPLPIWVCEG
jgi:hypothetical protein